MRFGVVMDVYFQQLADDLLAKTAASRTTIRLLDETGRRHLVAESLAPGTVSMSTGPRMEPADHDAYRFLVRERRLLIQEDCRSGEPRPPAALVEHFGVWAQMLAPVIVSDEIRGTISVHLQGATRKWGQPAIDALARARRSLEDHLAAAS